MNYWLEGCGFEAHIHQVASAGPLSKTLYLQLYKNVSQVPLTVFLQEVYPIIAKHSGPEYFHFLIYNN